MAECFAAGLHRSEADTCANLEDKQSLSDGTAMECGTWFWEGHVQCARPSRWNELEERAQWQEKNPKLRRAAAAPMVPRVTPR